MAFPKPPMMGAPMGGMMPPAPPVSKPPIASPALKPSPFAGKESPMEEKRETKAPNFGKRSAGKRFGAGRMGARR